MVGVEAVEPPAEVPVPSLRPHTLTSVRVRKEDADVEVAVFVREASCDAARHRHSNRPRLRAEERHHAIENLAVLKR
jgi:hypothetical protein